MEFMGGGPAGGGVAGSGWGFVTGAVQRCWGGIGGRGVTGGVNGGVGRVAEWRVGGRVGWGAWGWQMGVGLCCVSHSLAPLASPSALLFFQNQWTCMSWAQEPGKSGFPPLAMCSADDDYCCQVNNNYCEDEDDDDDDEDDDDDDDVSFNFPCEV